MAEEHIKNNDQRLKLTRNAKILLIIGGLFAVANGLSGTFVNVYLWKAENDFIKIGIFNLLQFIFIPLAFILGGKLSKGRNGTISLQIGILFHIIFYFSILLLGSKSTKYIVLLGILLGTGAGFYWLAANTLNFDLTSRYNRDTFNNYSGIVGSIAGMLAPLMAGYTISAYPNTTGYRIIFGLSLALFMFIILISMTFRIESNKDPFRLLKTWRQSSKAWKYMMGAQVLFGIRNGILMFLINLLVYISTNKESSIGQLSFVGSLLSIPVLYILDRILKPHNRPRFFVIGAIMTFISTSILALKINYMSLLIFTIMNTIFFPLFNIPFNSASLNTIEKDKQGELRIEYIVLKEIFLNIGRSLGAIAFIIVVKTWNNANVLRGFLLVIGSAQLWILSFYKKLDFDTEVMNSK